MKIGLIAGSFDLTTKGHVDVISQASKLVDKLYITIASNVGKVHRFSAADRKTVLEDCLVESDSVYSQYEVEHLRPNSLLIQQATALGVNVLFRGIRNPIDFEYVNKQLLLGDLSISFEYVLAV